VPQHCRWLADLSCIHVRNYLRLDTAGHRLFSSERLSGGPVTHNVCDSEHILPNLKLWTDTVNKLILAVAISALPLMNASAQEISLESDENKLSYSLGMLVGERVLKNYGDSLNYDAITAAMKARHSGGDTQMSIEEAQQFLTEFETKRRDEAAASAVANGQKFLDDNAARDEVTVTDSGLQWEEVEAGDGPKPSVDDTVSVHYVGTLIDGTEFDSSVARGQPAEFPLKGVIPGWTEGLQLMNVGSKYRFVIPAPLAYGERGAGQNIGPNETLVFSVELLEIK